MKYAKYINPNKVQYPAPDEFAGVINWQYHDAMLREKGYLPLVGEPTYPEEYDANEYEAIPKAFELAESCIYVTAWEYRRIENNEVSVDDYNAVLEEYLYSVCSEKGYTDREPSAYYFSSVAQWHEDAVAWVDFRDHVMLFALDVLNQYENTGVAPMTLSEFAERLEEIKINW